MKRIAFLQPRGKLRPDLVHDALLLVGLDVPVPSMEKWTDIELLMVYDWAMREHLSAADSACRRRKKPALIAEARVVSWEELNGKPPPEMQK